MEQKAEISCDGIRYTFLGIYQADNKSLLLRVVSIFVKITAF